MTKHLFTLVLILLSSVAVAQPTSTALAFSGDSPNALIQMVEGNPQKIESLESDGPIVTLLTIHGSNTVGESMAPNLAMAYLKAKGLENVRVEELAVKNEKVVRGDLVSRGQTAQIAIAAHGSSTGFKGLMSGEADIWASSRPAKDKEVKAAMTMTDLRADNSEHVVGIDGLAIIVHPENPINQLSKENLGRLFSGQVKNWSEIGGHDVPVSIYARDNNSGTWDSFKKMVLGKTISLSEAAVRYESSERLSDSVSRDRGGIGFIGMAFVRDSKLLAIADGAAQALQPTKLTVGTEDYALSRRLFLYTDDNPSNAYVQEFIRFAEGVHGQKLVKEAGFVSQNVSAINPQLGDDLPTDYLTLVEGAERLSVNFRFQVGSAKLDNKAVKDIERLVYFLKQRSAAPELLLIGFGDKRKNEHRSKLLSKLRAMAVRRELVRHGVYPKETTGYGEFNPVASFQGASRVKNRRVEVWLR